MNGGQICDINDRTVLGTAVGSGFGCIYMSNGAQSLSISGAQSQGGDRGLYVATGGGSAPGFIGIENYAVNIPAVAGVELAAGNQFWANQLWMSHSGGSTSSPVHGFVTGPSYGGFVNLSQCTLQQFPGHNMWLQGGSGYLISNSNFGIAGQSASNTYDECHIAAGVTNVTLIGNHFDVDPFMGLGSPPPRSAIFLDSGATDVAAIGNMWKNTGYGTSNIAGAGVLAVNSGNLAV